MKLGYALEMDGGGVWRLDLSTIWWVGRYVDRRVVVKGTRSGFDLLDVHHVSKDVPPV